MKQVFVWFPPERAPEPEKPRQWTWLRCVMIALALTWAGAWGAAVVLIRLAAVVVTLPAQPVRAVFKPTRTNGAVDERAERAVRGDGERSAGA